MVSSVLLERLSEVCSGTKIHTTDFLPLLFRRSGAKNRRETMGNIDELVDRCLLLGKGHTLTGLAATSPPSSKTLTCLDFVKPEGGGQKGGGVVIVENIFLAFELISMFSFNCSIKFLIFWRKTTFEISCWRNCLPISPLMAVRNRPRFIAFCLLF